MAAGRREEYGREDESEGKETSDLIGLLARSEKCPLVYLDFSRAWLSIRTLVDETDGKLKREAFEILLLKMQEWLWFASKRTIVRFG